MVGLHRGEHHGVDRIRVNGRIEEGDNLVHPTPGCLGADPAADISEHPTVALEDRNVAIGVEPAGALVERRHLLVRRRERHSECSPGGVRDRVHRPVVIGATEVADHDAGDRRGVRWDRKRTDDRGGPAPLTHQSIVKWSGPW
jgi:hypothetical protein